MGDGTGGLRCCRLIREQAKAGAARAGHTGEQAVRRRTEPGQNMSDLRCMSECGPLKVVAAGAE